MKTIKFKKNHEATKRIFFLFFALLSSLNFSAQTTFTIGILKYTTTGESTVRVTKNENPTGELVIPESVEYEGTQYSVTRIANLAFYSCTDLYSVTIPNSVETIGNSAFSYCTSLVSVIIGNAVSSIEKYSFFGCSSLTSVTIGNSVTSIGGCAFMYCRGLISVTIPNSVETIGNSAFSHCTGLTSVTIPNSVTSIENSAFAYCIGLTDIYCHIETPLTISSNEFQNVPKNTCTLHVPIGCGDAYRNADWWKEFNIVEDLPTGIVSIENSQLTIDNDVWHTLNGVRLNGKPTKAGVYIVNGKKVVIK